MRQSIIPSCLLTVYMYDCFKSIPLPVNSSKGVFDYCVDIRLVILFFPKCDISRKEDTNSILLLSCTLRYQMPHKLHFLDEAGSMQFKHY